MALSAVLAVCVIFLWIKISGIQSGEASTSEGAQLSPALSGEDGPRPTIVAFVNGDSLNAKYKFIVEKTKDLDQKMASAEERVKKEYGPRQAQYEQNIRYAQEHPEMSEAEAIALQKDIERLQTEMDGIQQREVGVLQKKEEELQEELVKRVNDFLAKYTKEHGIDYVVNKQSEFQVLLFGNPDYDITTDVLAGLNAEYEAEKQAK